MTLHICLFFKLSFGVTALPISQFLKTSQSLALFIVITKSCTMDTHISLKISLYISQGCSKPLQSCLLMLVLQRDSREMWINALIHKKLSFFIFWPHLESRFSLPAELLLRLWKTVKIPEFPQLFQNRADSQYWHHPPGSLGDIYMHAQLALLILCMCRLCLETPRVHPGPGPSVHMEVKNLLRHRPGGQDNNTSICRDSPQPVFLFWGVFYD